MTAGGVAVTLLSFAPTRPALIWNFSPSVPEGLYWLQDGAWVRHDLVAVAPTGKAQATLLNYGVIAPSRVLLKRVAGVAGDTVCRSSNTISINGEPVAIALATFANRQLPVWSGCSTLSSGQIFLLGEHPRSFDGRYFGPSRASDVVGRSLPIWTFRLGKIP